MAAEECEILSWVNLSQNTVYRVTEVALVESEENQDRYILSLADINNYRLKVWVSKKLIADLKKRGPYDESYLVSLGRQRCPHNRTIDLYELDFQTGSHQISLFTNMSLRKRKSLRSGNNDEKRMKLTVPEGNNVDKSPSMFDKIPIEILELMVEYLPKKSLIAWNRVNQRFYESSIEKLWRHPGSWLWCRARMHELSHLPIKILNSKMVRDSTLLDIVAKLPETLQEYIIDDFIYESEDFLKFLDCAKVRIIIDAAILCRSQEDNDCEESYVDTVNDLNIQVELDQIGKAHFYGEPCIEMVDDNDLKMLAGCHFRQFYIERIRHIDEKDDLMDFLVHAKIDGIYLNFFQFYTSHCKFDRNDITRIKNCNIKSISTSVLFRPNYMMYGENPWFELSQIKTLKHLIINPWTDFSLYRLQSFSFHAITIGHEKKRYVSNILELHELFECRCVTVYTRIQGPMWIYQFGVYVVVHLNNSQ